MPGSGVVRQYHLMVLRLVRAGHVARSPDFEYRCPPRARHVTEAVYLLEGLGHVRLHLDGTVTLTDAGTAYLVRRDVPLEVVPVTA